MQRLLRRDIVVPADNEGRYFRYRHAETGHWSHASTYLEWIAQAREHRRANNLTIPDDFEAQMENQLCDQLGPEWCLRTNGRSWVSTRFSLEDFVNGMKAFGRLLAGGFKFVDQAEADRRARICANCPYNQSLPGCISCQKISDFVTGDVANQHTPYDQMLKACAVCKCSNKAQVWFRMADLASTDTPEKQELYADHCWKQRASENYRAQGGQVASYLVHTQEIAGSNPAPATP